MRLRILFGRLIGHRECCYQRSSGAFSKATVVSVSSGPKWCHKRSTVPMLEVVVVFWTSLIGAPLL